MVGCPGPGVGDGVLGARVAATDGLAVGLLVGTVVCDIKTGDAVGNGLGDTGFEVGSPAPVETADLRTAPE
jgi:hypothetical protein